MYVSNAFLTRKGSAILHGNKLVFLTEWSSATSSCDITVISMQFFMWEQDTRCASEQSHENLHKVYKAHSA